MHNFFRILIPALFSVVLVSCKTGKDLANKNTPEYAAEMFLTHLNRLEFEQAKLYGTETTKSIVNLMQSMVALVPEQPAPQDVKVFVSHCDVLGDSGICYYTANEKSESIEMLRVDGVWLVNLKKESFTAPKVKPD
jgi:hypothetical protein